MYSWTDDTTDWYRPGSYLFDPDKKDARDAEAKRAAASGPRTYEGRDAPNPALIDPKKRITSDAKDIVVVGVDVTGSMSTWPFEIFDRLPLFYNTLAQYRPELKICFAAIGDAGVDRWPLQVTDFAQGYDLEQQLKALYGEGGGGDAPESYGLFAHWVKTHVSTPNCQRPFLIVFGDAPMHQKIPADQVRRLLGDQTRGDLDAIAEWQAVARSWSTWFLRRPTGRKGDEVDTQWKKAVGEYKVVPMQNEARAVDYAMGIVARTWGHFEDFKKNMAARQPDDQIAALEKGLDELKVRALSCPRCAAPIPAGGHGRFTCSYCNATLQV
jgi:hypothetical protein